MDNEMACVLSTCNSGKITFCKEGGTQAGGKSVEQSMIAALESGQVVYFVQVPEHEIVAETEQTESRDPRRSADSMPKS